MTSDISESNPNDSDHVISRHAFTHEEYLFTTLNDSLGPKSLWTASEQDPRSFQGQQCSFEKSPIANELLGTS